MLKKSAFFGLNPVIIANTDYITIEGLQIPIIHNGNTHSIDLTDLDKLISEDIKKANVRKRKRKSRNKESQTVTLKIPHSRLRGIKLLLFNDHKNVTDRSILENNAKLQSHRITYGYHQNRITSTMIYNHGIWIDLAPTTTIKQKTTKPKWYNPKIELTWTEINHFRHNARYQKIEDKKLKIDMDRL